jgi:flagellar hook-associated protein 1 FlgK
MGVNFSAFEIGRRALRANQLGLAVTGQNIANVNTPGYARRQVQYSPTAGDSTNLRQIGGDVTIDGIRALRNQFVETRLQTEKGITGRLEAKRDALAPVDAVFNDVNSPGGIHASLNGFFGAFRDLEAQPTSVSQRAVVASKAEALTTAFHSTRSRLTEIRTGADATLRSTVDQVNTLSAKVADLNAKISISENSGISTTDLRDQRVVVSNKLGELTGARAAEGSDGQVTLTLSDGRPLVVGIKSFSVEATSAPPNGLATLTLEGKPVTFTDGQVRGLQDAIGEISKHITSLDQMAESLAGRVNTLHASGSDLNGNIGTNFFATPASGTVTAANIDISAAIKADPRLVVTAANGAGSGDATIARSLAGLLQDETSVVGTQTGSYDSFYASLVTEAGLGVRSAEDALSTQQVILTQTQAQRDSVSGVSLDEEAINLLQYQKAYEAAARFLKVADEMTQTILSLAS